MKKKIQIVVPMAGYGSRLRPLTWSRPKPLIALAGRTALEYLLDVFSSLSADFDPEYIFIISPNAWGIQAFMEANYPEMDCKYIVQEEMKGQSHAIYLANELLHGPMIMSFSDTLISGDLAFLKNVEEDGIAWVQENPEPQRFGVAIPGSDGFIEKFIEKPSNDEHKLVIVGFYYFKDAQQLICAIEEQIQENIALKGEFYIADAINVMLKHGAKFTTKETEIWLDSGIPSTVLSTNQYFLSHGYDNSSEAAKRAGVSIIPPVYISPDAVVERSVIGPYVSIAAGCEICGSVIENTVMNKSTKITNAVLHDSLIGEKATIQNKPGRYFVGDNTIIE